MKLTQVERKKIKEMREILAQITFFYNAMQSEKMSAEVRQRCLENVREKKKQLEKYSAKLNWYLISEDKVKG
jgi:inosine/xanthosine triphosphate pyrophosphatase family protein